MSLGIILSHSSPFTVAVVVGKDSSRGDDELDGATNQFDLPVSRIKLHALPRCDVDVERPVGLAPSGSRVRVIRYSANQRPKYDSFFREGDDHDGFFFTGNGSIVLGMPKNRGFKGPTPVLSCHLSGSEHCYSVAKCV